MTRRGSSSSLTSSTSSSLISLGDGDASSPFTAADDLAVIVAEEALELEKRDQESRARVGLDESATSTSSSGRNGTVSTSGTTTTGSIASTSASKQSTMVDEDEDEEGVDDEEYEEEEEEEDEKEKVKMEDPKVITRMDISDDNDDGITKAQRESIDRLLLQTSKSVPTYSSKPSSITLSFNPFRSRDVSNILRRKLKQYIGDLQKLQKQTINEYVSSIFLFCILNLTYALTNTTDTMLRFRVVWRYKRNGRNNSRNFVSGPESHTFQFSNLVQNFEWKNLESKEIQYELR